ncbi:MAG: hypothetical protein JNK14_19255 [Chitinophagaceae bacterium]|nr:hypothetical protein [Chitinophagaceae bacterium]
MSIKNQLLLFLFILFFLGCAQKSKEENSANQICNCAEPYAKKANDLIKGFSNMTNVSEDKMKIMTTELQQYSDSIAKCTEKYKNELTDKKVIDLLKKNCPETAQQLGQ